jgi:hypothetical protein
MADWTFSLDRVNEYLDRQRAASALRNRAGHSCLDPRLREHLPSVPPSSGCSRASGDGESGAAVNVAPDSRNSGEGES